MLTILLLISYYALPLWGIFFLGKLFWVIYRIFKPSKMVVYMKDAYFISLFFYFLTLLFLIYGVYIYSYPNSRVAIDMIMFLPLLFGSHLMAEFIRHIAGKRLSPIYKETKKLLREIDRNLFSAVTNNDINSVLCCLNDGADPTAINDLGFSAEDYARGHGYNDIQAALKNHIAMSSNKHLNKNSLKCEICGSETNINWGNAYCVRCEKCRNITNHST